MKKKKLTKKLTLNKDTITILNPNEMSRIVGASVFLLCTESCSVFLACCDPIRNIIDGNLIQDKAQ